MNATLTAAAAALTAAGFTWTLDRYTGRALHVECAPLSDRVFDLIDTLKGAGVRVAPHGGYERITTVTAL